MVLLKICDVGARAWNFLEITSRWLFNLYLNNSRTLFTDLAPYAKDYNKKYAWDRWKYYVEKCIHECEFGAHLHNLRSWIGSWAWLYNHISCFIYYWYIITSWIGTTWITNRWVIWVWLIGVRTTASIVCRLTRVIYLLLCAVCCRICDYYDRWGTPRNILSTSTLRSLVVNRPIIGLQESLPIGKLQS